MTDLFHCVARSAEFTGELRGNLAACYHGDYCNDLYAISVAGHERTIQAIVAGLSKGMSGIEFFWEDFQPLRRAGAQTRCAVSCRPLSGGYHCHRQHLGYDTWHLLAWSKMTMFLLDGSEEALWRALRGERFTTPLLRQWMGQLREAMQAVGILKNCVTYGLERPSQLLMVTDLGLDKLVSDGIRAGNLAFHQPAAVAAVA